MLLHFKGYGLFVPAIFVGCFALVELVSLVVAARPAGNGWGLGVSLLLAGLICWFFGHWLKRRGSLLEDLRKSRQVGPEDCLRSFYWIKMEWWGPIFAALGLLCLLAAGCASRHSKPRSDISRTAQKAIESVQVGMVDLSKRPLVQLSYCLTTPPSPSAGTMPNHAHAKAATAAKAGLQLTLRPGPPRPLFGEWVQAR